MLSDNLITKAYRITVKSFDGNFEILQCADLVEWLEHNVAFLDYSLTYSFTTLAMRNWNDVQLMQLCFSGKYQIEACNIMVYESDFEQEKAQGCFQKSHMEVRLARPFRTERL